MPKELIHFTIAEKTAQRLADTRYAHCINDEHSGLLLGSIFHDALFYAIMPGGKPIEALAHRLHGATGEDTFTLIRMQANHAAAAKHPALPAAILVGMISHLFADVIMHPMVWYFTGNYYADNPLEKSQSRQRHRALEALMDMVACPDKIGHTQYLIRTQHRQCKSLYSQGLPIREIADLASMPENKAKRQLTTAWSIFASIQSLFPRTWLARPLFRLRSFLPNSFNEITSLFYAPQLQKQAGLLKGEIQYFHPATNEDIISSLEILMETAATLAEELCRKLENTVFDQEPLNLVGTGPSMDAGFSGMPTTEMLHFAIPPYPTLE